MEVENAPTNFNVSVINETLLAGLYASEYSNLEQINSDLYSSILKWDKLFAKLDESDENNEVSLITSVIASLIENTQGNLLLVVPEWDHVEKMTTQFKKVSSYIDSVNVKTIKEDLDARLIVTDVTNLSTQVDNIKYIVVNNCITKRLVKNLKYTNVNTAFLCNEINKNIIDNVKKITGETTVVEESANEPVTVVEESANEPVTVVKESASATTETTVVEESVNSNIELSTPIQRDNDNIESDSDSDSDIDLQELISQLNIPPISEQEKRKNKIKQHNKKILLQLRSRGVRR